MGHVEDMVGRFPFEVAIGAMEAPPIVAFLTCGMSDRIGYQPSRLPRARARRPGDPNGPKTTVGETVRAPCDLPKLHAIPDAGMPGR